MHSHHHATTPVKVPGDLPGRIARSLGIGETTLNEVDFDDLFMSENVVKALRHMTFAVLGHLPEGTAGEHLSAYWVDGSMDLVLCADSGEELHLVRVPGEQWTVKPHTCH